jgi:thiamine-phosphate pyrophosphorylase
VFPTTLKAMATPPQGLGRLHAYARLLHDRALVAIGGIGMEQLPDVAASGAGSFAVVRALVTAPDPEGSAQALMQRWAELKHGAKAPA